MVSVDAQKAAKDTKTDHELGFCHDPALPKEWGPRNTRKDAKGDEKCGLGGPCHIVRPTLDKGRAPARSGVACPKNVQRQYLTCPSELVLHGGGRDALRLIRLSRSNGQVRCSPPPMVDALRRVRLRRSGTRLWACCAGRAGTRIRSEALHRILTIGRPAADRAGARPYHPIGIASSDRQTQGPLR